MAEWVQVKAYHMANKGKSFFLSILLYLVDQSALRFPSHCLSEGGRVEAGNRRFIVHSVRWSRDITEKIFVSTG